MTLAVSFGDSVWGRFEQAPIYILWLVRTAGKTMLAGDVTP